MNVTKCSGKKLFYDPQLDCLIARGVFSEPFEVTIVRTCFEGRHRLAHGQRKEPPSRVGLDAGAGFGLVPEVAEAPHLKQSPPNSLLIKLFPVMPGLEE